MRIELGGLQWLPDMVSFLKRGLGGSGGRVALSKSEVRLWSLGFESFRDEAVV